MDRRILKNITFAERYGSSTATLSKLMEQLEGKEMYLTMNQTTGRYEWVDSKPQATESLADKVAKLEKELSISKSSTKYWKEMYSRLENGLERNTSAARELESCKKECNYYKDAYHRVSNKMLECSTAKSELETLRRILKIK